MTTTPENGIELQRELAKISAEREALEKREAELAARTGSETTPPTDTDPGSAGDEDSEGEDTPPPWPHDTVDFAGETWEVRYPTTDAALVWNMQVSKHAPASVRNDAPMVFLSKHMSEKSLARMLERLADPDDTDFGFDKLDQLLTTLFTGETSRPTQPS
ncbi:hypothetical protein QYN14_25455 [Rhodococcus ruber]|uniref:hypothetical protein n=1 Tax=Rhodococcus ruber TaxID=1830 RepID=UPI00265A155C|nr:hypothetical protein [Rhodococcus ruber]WKK11979.1 hypothetical protein QYN14_25455 [Rhodococcus ruber]